jgi:transposase InsO family protein
MTDNPVVYRQSRDLCELLEHSQIRHIRTPPYTPRWNGMVERFIQTLQNEWAYSRTWPNPHTRARSLQSFIRYYNRIRTSVGRTATPSRGARRGRARA